MSEQGAVPDGVEAGLRAVRYCPLPVLPQILAGTVALIVAVTQ